MGIRHAVHISLHFGDGHLPRTAPIHNSLTVLCAGPYVGRLGIAHILGWKLMSIRHYAGWMSILSNLCNAPLGAVYLMWIVSAVPACLGRAIGQYSIAMGLYSLRFRLRTHPREQPGFAPSFAFLGCAFAHLGMCFAPYRSSARMPLGLTHVHDVVCLAPPRSSERRSAWTLGPHATCITSCSPGFTRVSLKD